MKRSILASLALALTLVSSAAMAAPKSGCCDASSRAAACGKAACCDAPCCASAKGATAKKAFRGKAAHSVKKARKPGACCSMPCCDGGACGSGAAGGR